MRIRSIKASGFRAFSESVALDVDADVVIIRGENGQGKTSAFDAVHWALTGSLSRLGNDESAIISMYSSSGLAKVVLDLLDTQGHRLRVIRSYDGENQKLTLESNSNRFQGKKAEVEL